MGQPKRDLDGWSSKAFFQPGNVTVLKPAECAQIHLGPAHLQPPLDEDVRECLTELPEIFQATQCRNDFEVVALTIGKDNALLGLTLLA